MSRGDPTGGDDREWRGRRAEVEALIEHRAFSVVYQPIVHLESGGLSGVEALCRFDDGRPPDYWFAMCREVGLADAMDMVVIETVLGDLYALPDTGYLSINLSVATLQSVDLLLELLAPALPARAIVLELTEHAVVDDYEAVTAAVDRLRAAGLHFAVDDAGAGYATFRHIVRLRPDIIKLDRSITEGINDDPAHGALAAALVIFAGEIGASVVAEGVETDEELMAVRTIGISRAQGFGLSYPQPLPVGPTTYQPVPFVDLVGASSLLRDNPRAIKLPSGQAQADAVAAVLAHDLLTSTAAMKNAIGLLRQNDGELPVDEFRALCAMLDRQVTHVNDVLMGLVRGLSLAALQALREDKA